MALTGTRFNFALFSALAAGGDYDGAAVVDRQVSGRLANGTDAGEADKLFSDLRSLAGAADEDLDLTTLTDAFGAALALVEVVGVMIEVGASNNGNLVLSPGASNGWAALVGASSTLILRPGATAVFMATGNPAWAVSGSAKVLNVENLGAGTGTYRITLLGRSA